MLIDLRQSLGLIKMLEHQTPSCAEWLSRMGIQFPSQQFLPRVNFTGPFLCAMFSDVINGEFQSVAFPGR